VATKLLTDLSDYAPGSTAFFTADGFGFGDALSFQVYLVDPGSDGIVGTLDDVLTAGPGGTSWTVIDGGTTDLNAADGTVTTNWYVDPFYANMTLLVTVTDLTTGQTVSQVFTDSPSSSEPLITNLANTPTANLAPDAGGLFAGTQVTVNGAVIFGDVTKGTGSGNFQSFLRIQAQGTEQGFNTDGSSSSNPVLDDLPGSPFIHSIKLSDLGLVADANGNQYYEFSLDLAQLGQPGLLSLDQLKIYQAGTGDLTSLSSLTPQFTLFDSAQNPRGWLELQNIGAGNGQSDYVFLIPKTAFNSDPYVYLYSEFGGKTANGGDFRANSSFEEWAYLSNAPPPPQPPTAVPVVDKQISGNGTGWVDQGIEGAVYDPSNPTALIPNLNDTAANVPVILVGNSVYLRAIVSNDGDLPMTASVNDANPAGTFIFGGQSSVNVSVGLPVTSDTLQTTALAGYRIDTATVTGTVINAVGTDTETASDQANYYGATPGVTLDKQVSGNGTDWTDLDSDLTAPVVLVGSKVYFQAIATNTTDDNGAALAITGAAVTDDTGLSFSGSSTIGGDGGHTTYTATLLSALAGLNKDKATVSGTVSDSFDNSAPVSAYDSANYYGATPGINVEKLVSVNGGTDWYFREDDPDDTIPNISSLTGIAPIQLHVGTPTTLAGATVKFKVVVQNTTDGGLGMTSITVTDHEDTTNTNLSSFIVGASLSSQSHELSTEKSLTALSGTHVDTATASGTVTDNFGNSASPQDTDSAAYNGLALGIPGLTAGFWSTHPQVWDVTTSDDSTWVKQLYNATPKVISQNSDLNPTPRYNWDNSSSATPVVTSVQSTGYVKSGAVGDSGLLLGDLNHNGLTDETPSTLTSGTLPNDLYFDLYAAQQTLLAPTTGDARVIMANQALAAQLNEYNGYVQNPANTGPNGLIQEAVKWLLGGGQFGNNASNIDLNTTNDVVGPEIISDNLGSDYTTSGGFKFISPALSSSNAAWNGFKTVISNYNDLYHAGVTVMADGEGLKNALQAYNMGRLVVSQDGTTIGWNNNGSIVDPTVNSSGSFWVVLHDQAVANPTLLHGII
jgi:hypothetical protein